MTRRVLFLCTGNSCRSQMAEGWGHALLGDCDVEVYSAGIECHGLNPKAVQVMAEAGIDISGQTSDLVTDDLVRRMDLVVTVCGHADEHCPAIPAGIAKRHWPLPDPARFEGDADTILNGFRKVRDDVRDLVKSLRDELA